MTRQHPPGERGAAAYRALRRTLAPVRKVVAGQRHRVVRNRENVPPGHFYSALPSARDIAAVDASPAERVAGTDGVDLRIPEQWALIDQLAPFAATQPFDDPHAEVRYRFDNPSFSYGDGLFLHAVLRHLRPARVVEVGSGYSSACILDTAALFLDGATECTFIDPEPALVQRLVGARASAGACSIIGRRVQDVDRGVFATLRAGDVLFVDSSHVSKVASDVNFLLFDVLPALRPGVVVHFHDIFPGFEYPRAWLEAGRAWNEAYLLRAFLQFNDQFEILLWPSLLWEVDQERMTALFPRAALNRGASLYVVRAER